MVFDKMSGFLMVGLSNFRSHLKSRPFINQTLSDHSKSVLVWISDPHCTFIKTSKWIYWSIPSRILLGGFRSLLMPALETLIWQWVYLFRQVSKFRGPSSLPIFPFHSCAMGRMCLLNSAAFLNDVMSQNELTTMFMGLVHCWSSYIFQS